MDNAMESAGTEYPANATTAAAVDLIGGIPYDVLTTILSLLPVRDAARTALLSSQWRHLWKSAPLCLDDCAVNSSSNDDNEWRARAISSILASHHGPIRRFSLSHTLLCARKSLVHSWFQTLSQKQVQHVQFNYLLFPRPGPEIPASLFACESLLTLTLRNSRFPDTTEPHLNLVRLTELNLIATSLTDAHMQSIISSCTALRSLMILGNSSIRQIRLRSRSLLSLTLSFCRNLEELIIEDAPNLDRLIGSELMSTARVKVVGAPKLSILGLIDIHMPIERLELGSSVFMGADATLGSLMHSLKILAVAMKFGSYQKVKMLIDLLRCFPCLERLHIECSSWSFLDEPDFEYSKYSKLSAPIACLDRHLKTVKLKDYLGEECELEFVKFLLAKARMLKVAEFEFADSCDDITISQQKHLIRLLNRASADTQFSFFPRKPHSGNFNKHTSTLSLSDPFDS